MLDLRQHDLAPGAERHIGGKPSCPLRAHSAMMSSSRRANFLTVSPPDVSVASASGRSKEPSSRFLSHIIGELQVGRRSRPSGQPAKFASTRFYEQEKTTPSLIFWGFSDCLTFRQKTSVKGIVGILPQAANKHQRSYQQNGRMPPPAGKPLWANEALKHIEKSRLSRIPSPKLDFVE